MVFSTSALGKHASLFAEESIFKQKDLRQTENKVKALAAFI